MTDLSRTTSTASSQRSNSSQNVPNAALAGASLAFGGRPTVANGRAQDIKSNGALAAAASAGGHSNNSSPTRSIARTTTDESVQSLKSVSSLARDVTMGAPNLALPSPPARGLSVSPSQQAASLASARAPPPSVKPAGQGNKTASERVAATKTPAVPPKPRRLSSYTQSVERSEDNKPTDDTPIAPTTSLVSIFEQKSGSPQSTTAKPAPFIAKPNNELPLKSPKPVRATSGITTMIQMEQAKAQSSSPAPTNDASQTAHREAENIRAQPPVKPATLASTTAVSPEPPMPPPRRQDATAGAENTYLERIKSQNALRGRSQPPLPPLRNNAPEPIPIDRTTTNKSYTSVTSVTSPSDTLSPGSASNKSMHAQWNYLHPKKLAPNMTGDQLADAIVAGSLASSRQTSPTRSNTIDQPPPLPHRRAKHHTFSLSRTPSPAKAAGLRKTLRQAQSDTDDEEHVEERLYPYSKHKVQKRLGKHPNKHHEGDRKRWREAVTERERKRYEGVWAANKGMFVSYTAEERRLLDREPEGQQARDVRDAVADQVSNIVVRDVWSRSRLSETILETVWDLVDNERVGRLSKEEFVVGLWLIDGRLKGKKLPVKVSDSVWTSVKALGNIKVRRVL